MRAVRGRALLPLLSIGIGAATLCSIDGPVARVEGRNNPEAIATLDVRLSVPSSLPDSVRTSMIDEATSIWRRQGVVIGWKSGAPEEPRRDHTLRILVRPSRSTTAKLNGKTMAVGELLRGNNGRAVALTSLDAAERILREIQPYSAGIQDAVYFRRLGLVLGRATAHEIGHYILESPEHARDGLMKARHDARDFADLRSGGFELDRESKAWLDNRYAPAASRAVVLSDAGAADAR